MPAQRTVRDQTKSRLRRREIGEQDMPGVEGKGSAEKLRVGAWVEVRSKEEILRTLDSRGRLDGMPFMPQMFDYCGKRFKVHRRAHKTCDTVTLTGGRRLNDVVHLEDIRCHGND